MALYAFDGTWNTPDDNQEDKIDHNTNVFLFAQLYAQAHGEDAAALRSEYLKGVGTRMGRTGKIVGGLTGAGGRNRIREMITHCERAIVGGDPVIDIVGFSRGAALALHFANRLFDKGIVGAGTPGSPNIRFIGLWDTVPAFGLPGAYLDFAKDTDLGWDLDVPRNIKLCAHAIARHERRQAFDVHRLDDSHRYPFVTEMWFRGNHSDVGGGNGNAGLSSISLRWVMEQARTAGVPFSDDQIARVMATENPKAAVSRNSWVGEEIDRGYFENDAIHETAGRRLAVGEKKRITVDSRCIYDYSGITVRKGDAYLIAPDSTGRWKDDSIVCDATGWPNDISRSRHLLARIKEGILESRAVGMLRRVRDANWFEMCLSVGFNSGDAEAVGDGRYARSPWKASVAGPLNFFANDALRPLNKYDNNEGSIEVEITRVA